ncbi:uncharacterized protein RHIMIDRAFT_274513, partial [Rhizopus microsporus ATCC 52813]
MFIGNRGIGVGSRIKRYQRYGGDWKQKLHEQETQVCITNENMTSQTCVYCFSKLDHPIHKRMIKGKEITVTSKGPFICRNPKCVLVTKRQPVKSRDTLSALTVGLLGLSYILFHRTFPCCETSLSQSSTEFTNITSSFLNARERLGSDDVT